MSEKILEIKDERLSFFTPAGEVKALNGVSFSMNQGDVLGIVGESGSGKSVTAYSIMGLTAYPGRLVGGTVWFNGHQIDKMTEKEFRKIRGNEVSIIFQDPMTSLNRCTPSATRSSKSSCCTPKRPSRKPGPALRSCWSWSASTSRTAA